MPTTPQEPLTAPRGQAADVLENQHPGDEFGETLHKSKVECICPKCSRRHIMAIHWIGRGTPRKFCSVCRDSAAD